MPQPGVERDGRLRLVNRQIPHQFNVSLVVYKLKGRDIGGRVDKDGMKGLNEDMGQR